MSDGRSGIEKDIAARMVGHGDLAEVDVVGQASSGFTESKFIWRALCADIRSVQDRQRANSRAQARASWMLIHLS